MHLRTGNSVHGKLETFSAETLIEPIRKTKVLNESFNQFVYKFYLQCYLNFGRIFTKKVKCKLDNSFRCFLVNFMKNGYQLEKRK